MTHPAITVEAPDRRAPCRYLAIEGPIGAGKTSLAQRLVERWSMRPLFERVEKGEIEPSFVVTHRRNIEDAPQAYEIFETERDGCIDGCIKVVLKPS